MPSIPKNPKVTSTIKGWKVKKSIIDPASRAKHIYSFEEGDAPGKDVMHAQQLGRNRVHVPKGKRKTTTSTTYSMEPNHQKRFENSLNTMKKNIRAGNAVTVKGVPAKKIDVHKVNPKGKNTDYPREKPIDLGPKPVRTHIKFGTHDITAKSYNGKTIDHFGK